MSTQISKEDWLNALHESADELAQVALGLDGARPLDRKAVDPLGLHGGYVALVGDASAVQIGVASSPDGCQRLSKALLAMEPDEPDLPLEDLADTMCEIGNIVAGGVKGRVDQQDGEMKIGLPLFVHGSFSLAADQELSVKAMEIGDVNADLIVIHPR